MKPVVERFTSGQSAHIYRIPLSLFPGMYGYAHLIADGKAFYLFDVGSGFGDSNEDLQSGLDQVGADFGEPVTWDRIQAIFISHGHIDHFGGLHYVRQHCAAPIVIHELERRVLTDYEARLQRVAERLGGYLVSAGLNPDEQEQVMGLYLLHKHLFSSIEVQATFEEWGMRAGRIRFEHVPGHCPGQVMAWVDDILLSSDHILKETSPHQAPESLSMNMGLEHYLQSLYQVLPHAEQARCTLGGHEGPIEDLPSRIREIALVHRQRLEQILERLHEAMSLNEIASELFPITEGYHRLLALEEAGAHVEYLVTRGYINFEERQDGVRIYAPVNGAEPLFPGFKRFFETSTDDQ